MSDRQLFSDILPILWQELQELRLAVSKPDNSKRFSRLALLLGFSLIVVSAIICVGIPSLAVWFVSLESFAENHKLLFLLLLFSVWTLLFVTVAPLGSLTVLIAGFFFGPLVGLIQAGSQMLSSIFLYLFLPEPQGRSLMQMLILGWFLRWPIVFVALIRLVPILPSAVSVILFRETGIKLRNMVIGTLTTGWIRPVFLAWSGSQIPSVAGLLEPYIT